MGRRSRQRERAHQAKAPSREYRDADGNTLTLRGSLPPAARREYAETLRGGLDRDDATQRGVELLFERLAVSWTIAGLTISKQDELLGRYRLASPAERAFVRDALREHAAENFPELTVP